VAQSANTRVDTARRRPTARVSRPAKSIVSANDPTWPDYPDATVHPDARLATRSLADAVLTSLSEEELARWRSERGVKVLLHRGRYWEVGQHGFCHAIHWLARFDAVQATRPTPFCWGYRATLAPDSASLANSYMPVHLAQHVADYNLASLPSKRRNQIRSCHRQVEIVEVLDPALLAEQGHAVYASAQERTGHGRRLSREEFATLARQQINPGRSLVLAGMVKGRIAGYLVARAVDGTAYIDEVFLATESLPTNVGSGLVFEFMQVCRRAGIREVVYGLNSREDVALSRYKHEMGFPVVNLPARIWMLPFASPLIRRYRPHVHFRLFGSTSP
jgi:hypothetical protein